MTRHDAALTSDALRDLIAAAEQRGREDNADHGMCYVSGSKALKAKMAAAWDEGYVRGVRDEAGDMERADNPYRDTERAQ